MTLINGVIFKSTISKGICENIVIWQNLSRIFKQTPKSPRSWVEVNSYTIFIMKIPRNIFSLLHFMYIITLPTTKMTLLLAEALLLQYQTGNQKLFLFGLKTNTLQRLPGMYTCIIQYNFFLRNNSIFGDICCFLCKTQE